MAYLLMVSLPWSLQSMPPILANWLLNHQFLEKLVIIYLEILGHEYFSIYNINSQIKIKQKQKNQILIFVGFFIQCWEKVVCCPVTILTRRKKGIKAFRRWGKRPKIAEETIILIKEERTLTEVKIFLLNKEDEQES